LFTRLSGPRSRTTAAQKNLATPGIEPGTPVLVARDIAVHYLKFVKNVESRNELELARVQWKMIHAAFTRREELISYPNFIWLFCRVIVFGTLSSDLWSQSVTARSFFMVRGQESSVG
jgi:hypothetical protein